MTADEFRQSVNLLANEFQHAALGHDYATVTSALFTFAIALLTEPTDKKIKVPPNVIAVIALMDDLRFEMLEATLEHGMRES